MAVIKSKSTLKRVARRLGLLSKPESAGNARQPVGLPRTKPVQPDPHVTGPRFVFSDSVNINKSVARIIRKNGLLRVVLHESILHPQEFSPRFPRLIKVLQYYSKGVSAILDHCEENTGRSGFLLDLSDGGNIKRRNVMNSAEIYAFCRPKNRPDIGLIPDPLNLNDLSENISFPHYRDKHEAQIAYEGRNSQIFWRGSTTGRSHRHDAFTNQRIRFCQDALEYVSAIDAKITNIVQFPDNPLVFETLKNAGLMSPPVNESAFSDYMATIDLDGNTAAWGALRKYSRLVHVIKPRSDFEVFYHVAQPTDTVTTIENVNDVFGMLKQNADYPNDFETAWQGYLFAQEVRRKVMTGDATIFPVAN